MPNSDIEFDKILYVVKKSDVEFVEFRTFIFNSEVNSDKRIRCSDNLKL